MADGHIFAGVVHWPGGADMTAPPGSLGGVFRLPVGGTAWQAMTEGLPSPCNCTCLTVDPHDPGRVYAGTQAGPYVSDDAGATWRRLDFPDAGQVWAIGVHPADRRRLLVGTSPIAVHRSDDAGATWRTSESSRLGDLIPMGGFRNRVMRFAFNPADPDEVFAALEVRGVMRSADGGATWQDCSADLLRQSEQEHLRSAILTDSPSEGMLDAHAVCLSAAAPGRPIAALRLGLFAGADGGARWQDLELRQHSPIFYARDVRVSPLDPNTLYACLSDSSRGQRGTVWTSPDVGRTWRRFHGPDDAHSTMMAVAASPRDAAVVYAAAREGEVFGTVDGGGSWQAAPLPQGCGGVMALAAA